MKKIKNNENITINKLNDKLKKMTSYFLSVCLVAIRRLFCDEFNETKELWDQLIFDLEVLNDGDFVKNYGFTKDYCRSDDFKLEFCIHTELIGKAMAEFHDLTEEKLVSSGRNYAIFGYDIAKMYINDPDFHTGVYDHERGFIRFDNIDYSTKKMKDITSAENFFANSTAV